MLQDEFIETNKNDCPILRAMQGCGRLIYLLLALQALAFWAAPKAAYATAIPEDRVSAVILSYQRIGEDRHPATNIREEQFESQISELLNGDYNILALPAIITALENDIELPPKTIALTFDGGYRSAFEKAFPILIENDIPFTIFVSPYSLDSNDQFAREDMLKKIARNKLVSVGLHSADYIHLLDADQSEIRRQVNNALTWYRDLFGEAPELFAYPFGEYNNDYMVAVKKAGFKAAFGQQSGVAYNQENMLGLPRFVMTESYADLNRFRLIATALPFPVKDIIPPVPVITKENPVIGFTPSETIKNIESLSCFISGAVDPAELMFIGKQRIELRLQTSFYDDRYRVNCTLPESFMVDEEPILRWRWFGMLLTQQTQAHERPDAAANSPLQHD